MHKFDCVKLTTLVHFTVFCIFYVKNRVNYKGVKYDEY